MCGLMSFDKCIQFCNLHHKSRSMIYDTPKKFPYTPLQSMPSPQPQPLTTSALFSIPLVLLF